MEYNDYNLVKEFNDFSENDKNQEASLKKIKSKYILKQTLLLIQIILSILTILSVLFLKNFNPPFYKHFQIWYKEKINDSLVAGSDIDKYKNAFNSILPSQKKDKSSLKIPFKDINLSVTLSKPTANGSITSPFGNRIDPITQEKKTHHGLDIGTCKGEKILAVMPGTIKKVSFNNSYGNYVIIDHGNNIETLYAHCDEIKVLPDQFVNRKQVVASVGSSGRSTGNHLHIELLINGKRQNPAQFLKGNYVNL